MNDYTINLCKRLLTIQGNDELIRETIEHIRSLVSSAKEGWRYTSELEQERVRLTNEFNKKEVYGINAGDKSYE